MNIVPSDKFLNQKVILLNLISSVFPVNIWMMNWDSSITIIGISTLQTAGGSTGIPSLKKGDGIFMGSSEIIL